MSPSTEALPSAVAKRWEVADIFREFGEAYRRENFVPHAQRKVMHALTVCRTSYLGGHVEKCNKCGFEQHAYNSCRNRHCPKCQNTQREAWIENRKQDLLPVPYFHVVFTVTDKLNSLFMHKPVLMYNLLFQSAVASHLQIIAIISVFFGLFILWREADCKGYSVAVIARHIAIFDILCCPQIEISVS